MLNKYPIIWLLARAWNTDKVTKMDNIYMLHILHQLSYKIIYYFFSKYKLIYCIWHIKAACSHIAISYTQNMHNFKKLHSHTKTLTMSTTKTYLQVQPRYKEVREIRILPIYMWLLPIHGVLYHDVQWRDKFLTS